MVYFAHTLCVPKACDALDQASEWHLLASQLIVGLRCYYIVMQSEGMLCVSVWRAGM